MSPNVPQLDLSGIEPRNPPRTAVSPKDVKDRELPTKALSATLMLLGTCALSTSILRSIWHRENLPAVGTAGVALVGLGCTLNSGDAIKVVASALGLGLGVALSY